VTRILVRSPGPFTTVQDLGRRGRAHWGVARSGAADRASLRLANRLVGNAEGAPGLEVLAGGAALESTGEAVVAVAGARCAVLLNGRPQGQHVALRLRAGDVLRLGPTSRGVRAYIAVRGGLVVAEVLGSCSYDQLGDLGPPPLRAGDVLAVGEAAVSMPSWEELPVPELPLEPVLHVLAGPRDDWLYEPGLEQLTQQAWTVLPASDRTGVRLSGTAIARREGELASEGMVPGSVQVPADGQPILLGPDAGVTGGYPVIAVVIDADVDVIGQLAPGTSVRFRTFG
jgi:biotin-dependent carboxylase-like uncharacterized protein